MHFAGSCGLYTPQGAEIVSGNVNGPSDQGSISLMLCDHRKVAIDFLFSDGLGLYDDRKALVKSALGTIIV